MSEAADVGGGGERPALPWRDLSARRGDPLMWVQTRHMRLDLTRVTDNWLQFNHLFLYTYKGI